MCRSIRRMPGRRSLSLPSLEQVAFHNKWVPCSGDVENLLECTADPNQLLKWEVDWDDTKLSEVDSEAVELGPKSDIGFALTAVQAEFDGNAATQQGGKWIFQRDHFPPVQLTSLDQYVGTNAGFVTTGNTKANIPERTFKYIMNPFVVVADIQTDQPEGWTFQIQEDREYQVYNQDGTLPGGWTQDAPLPKTKIPISQFALDGSGRPPVNHVIMAKASDASEVGNYRLVFADVPMFSTLIRGDVDIPKDSGIRDTEHIGAL